MIDKDLLEQLQKTAHLAAWRAGQIVREQYTQPRNVHVKGPRDLVTDTDFAAQAAALEVVRQRHPDHFILAEEDSEAYRRENDRWYIPDGFVWAIDPLDGTTNYTTGLPINGVSVGVLIDGKPVVGAIYDPLREELFLGASGQGATLNGRPIPPLRAIPLDDAIVSLDWGHSPISRERSLAGAVALAPRCRTVRALGSAALGLAYAACGRVGVYLNFGLQPWDMAAGAVLVIETGGDLRHPYGDDWRLDEPALIAGHPTLLDEAQPLVQRVDG